MDSVPQAGNVYIDVNNILWGCLEDETGQLVLRDPYGRRPDVPLLTEADWSKYLRFAWSFEEDAQREREKLVELFGS